MNIIHFYKKDIERISPMISLLTEVQNDNCFALVTDEQLKKIKEAVPPGFWNPVLTATQSDDTKIYGGGKYHVILPRFIPTCIVSDLNRLGVLFSFVQFNREKAVFEVDLNPVQALFLSSRMYAIMHPINK